MTSIPPIKTVNREVSNSFGAPRVWRVGTLAYTAGGLAILFVWLLGGDFALSVRDRATGPIMQVMFKKFGASDMFTGIIFSSVPSALGMIISPIVAFRSDRLRSRWGRRIPFMLVPAPFITLATVGLAFTPQLGQMLSHALGSASPGLDTSSLIAMSICWAIFEVGCITTYAVFGAFMADVVPQAVMGLFFGLNRAVSLLAGMAFFFNLMGQAKDHFTWIFLAIGAIYFVAFVLMCVKVKEGDPPPTVDIAGPHPGIFDALKGYFREGYGNPYYLWFFAAVILGGTSTGAFNLFSLYYSESLGVSDDAYGKCIGWSYFTSFLLSVPIGLAADRYHPLRLSMAMLALYAVIMFEAGFLVHNPPGFIVAFYAHTVISGSLFTAWASLTQRLLPRGNFGVINSAGGILGSITGIIFAPAVGHILDLTHHDYHYTFFINAEITLATLIAFYAVHRRFMALGGPKNYVAPE